MTLKPLTGFRSLVTHHCVTGSMRHVYVFNEHPISEEMLLGLGGGVGFVYWHMKGTDPFIGGRGRGRPGQGFEACAGERTGVAIEAHVTSSARRAEQSLLALLDAGQPVMVQVDMGFLPYLDFGGTEYHFGAHYVVVCGHDPETRQALVADRDEELHPVSMEALERARGSRHKPFPPQHRWYTFDFTHRRPPSAAEVRAAIAEQAEGMLEPPIRNLGVEGIRKAARAVPRWPDSMDEESLRWALFNAYIFISPVGGSGGGLFRTMFGRFLREAAEMTGDGRLEACAGEFRRIGDEWEKLGEWFRRTSEGSDPASVLGECAAPLKGLADREEAAWARVRGA